jgi:hypothetical protein
MAEAASITPVKSVDNRIPIHFELDNKIIDAASIKPATFASFANCIALAHKMTTPPAFAARLLRVRMSQQVAY